MYIGEIKKGKKEGNGLIFDEFGNLLFEGEFKNDEYNGKGKYYENNIL